MVEIALEHAERGFRILPLYPPIPGVKKSGKRPRFPGWQFAGTTDEQTIRTWWSDYPDSNIGALPPEHWIVLDVDGPEGAADLAQAERDLGPLPPTLTTRTGSGGRHLIFGGYDGRPVHSRFGPAQRIDIRHGGEEGGQIVLPGSHHFSGGVYSIEREARVRPLPAAWLAALSRPEEPAAAPTSRGAVLQLLPAHVRSELTREPRGGTERHADFWSMLLVLRWQGLNDHAIRLLVVPQHPMLYQHAVKDGPSSIAAVMTRELRHLAAKWNPEAGRRRAQEIETRQDVYTWLDRLQVAASGHEWRGQRPETAYRILEALSATGRRLGQVDVAMSDRQLSELVGRRRQHLLPATRLLVERGLLVKLPGVRGGCSRYSLTRLPAAPRPPALLLADRGAVKGPIPSSTRELIGPLTAPASGEGTTAHDAWTHRAYGPKARALVDELLARPGQTTTELVAALASRMSRRTVLSKLTALRTAGLVRWEDAQHYVVDDLTVTLDALVPDLYPLAAGQLADRAEVHRGQRARYPAQVEAGVERRRIERQAEAARCDNAPDGADTTGPRGGEGARRGRERGRGLSGLGHSGRARTDAGASPAAAPGAW